jgi:hypothetical protein
VALIFASPKSWSTSLRSRISLPHIFRDCDQFRIPLRIASKLASDKTVRSYAEPAAAIRQRGNNLQPTLTNLPLDDVLDLSVYYGRRPRKGIEITKIGRHVDDRHFRDHLCIDISRDVVEYDGLLKARAGTGERLDAREMANGKAKARCTEHARLPAQHSIHPDHSDVSPHVPPPRHFQLGHNHTAR